LAAFFFAGFGGAFFLAGAFFSLALFSPAFSSRSRLLRATARQEQQAWAPVVAEQERPLARFGFGTPASSSSSSSSSKSSSSDSL